MNLQHSIIFCHAFPAYFRHNEPNKGSRVRALSTVACIKSPADLPHHFTSLIRGPKRLRREAAPTALWGKVGSLTNLPPINPFRVFPPQGCCKKKKTLCHCTHEWRSLFSAGRPRKFCVAINYCHRGRHIWAYYHKASQEDVSCCGESYGTL